LIRVNLESKHIRLQELLRDAESVVVAFSGGVDSAFLLAAAHRTLGRDKCLGVTAVSESLAPEEYEDARRVAELVGAQWTTVVTKEMEDEGYRANTKERCYYCKRELFSTLSVLAAERGFNAVLDGFNADDVGDWRPGARAGKEKGVRSPLKDAGLTKQDIRDLSKQYGLPTWDKPSFACLASRLPYGTEVTPEKLALVAAAESALRVHGLRTFRVRYHGAVARLELGVEELQRIAVPEFASEVRAEIIAIGFSSVTVDLAGFRSGSQNEGATTTSEEERLVAIASEKSVLRKLGFPAAGFTRDEKMIRIQCDADDFARLLADKSRPSVVEAYRGLGYVYIAADIP
jgi:uncharacterized protein